MAKKQDHIVSIALDMQEANLHLRFGTTAEYTIKTVKESPYKAKRPSGRRAVCSILERTNKKGENMILLITDGVPREAVNKAPIANQITQWQKQYPDAVRVSIHIFPYRTRCVCGIEYTEKEFLKLPWSRNWEYDLNSYQIHDCTCGSTIGWPVRTTDPDALEYIWMQARGENDN
jgi:hypothetical protein